VVLLGALFVGLNILSGVQDGVAQGFEIVGTLARLKVAVSLGVLLVVAPAAWTYGLTGVVAALLTGVVVKYLLLHRAVQRCRREQGVPDRGDGLSFRRLLGSFAVPSMAVSLLGGFVTWLGMFLLSKQSGGFDQVAIASTGLQWRGPVLWLAASLGGVAVPAFGRLSASGDRNGARRLRRRLSMVSLVMAALVTAGMIAGSGVIMQVYGSEFVQGRLAFCLIGASTIPTVVANVYLHELVGAARMWRQLWLHGPSTVALCVAFVWLVPEYQAAGYAAALLLGSLVLLVQVVVADALLDRPALA